MKNRKLIIVIAAVAAVLILAAVISVQAFGDSGFFPSLYYAFKSAPKERVLQTHADSPDGQIRMAENGTTLRYVESVSYERGDRFDDYADEAGNTYKYDKNGNLVMFRGGMEAVNVLNATVEGELSEAEAADIGLRAGRCLFGEILDGFELDSCTLCDDGWSVQYVKKTGFAVAAYSNMIVQTDGTVTMCGLGHYYDYTDLLDPSVLDGVSQQDVDAFVAAEMKNKYPNCKAVGFKSYFLDRKNGKLYIEAEAVMQDEQGGYFSDSAFYPL